jgi:hypothetical protein
MKKITLSTLILVLGMAAGALHAQLLRVPSVYPTIQAAVDAAGYGDTILVAPGTYLENIMIQGNVKTLTLASNFIFSSDTSDINNTIIDGSNPVNPNFGMVVFIKNQDSTLSSKITGFTLTGGTGYYKTRGGGIYCIGAAPVIAYNHIEDCSITGTGPTGAGIYFGIGDSSSVIYINHNLIKNNIITSASNTILATGAGISGYYLNAVIEDNIITDNMIAGNSTTDAAGAGIYFYKYDTIYHSYVIIQNNKVTYNQIESWGTTGAGLWLEDGYGFTEFTVVGNTISDNECRSTGSNGYAMGGGIYLYNPGIGCVISTNIISGNSALEGPTNSNRLGGGIYIQQNTGLPPKTNPLIEKNRITGNLAFEGAGITCRTIGATITNNFISGNQADIRAGAIYFLGNANTISVAEVINNTITSNSVTGQGGEAGSIYFNAYNSFLLMNNIFYGNQAETSDEMKIVASIVQIHNCDINTDEITGTWTGENNFYADPEFIDEMSWDCLNQAAPCSNTGIDQITAFNQLFEAPAEDILNTERPQDEFFDVGAVEVKLCFVGLPEVVSRQSSVVSYPNPFISSTTFEYTLEESGLVTLEIFNQVGLVEVVLINENQTAGTYKVPWNAEGIPAGVYYYSLRAGKQVQTGKIIVMK